MKRIAIVFSALAAYCGVACAVEVTLPNSAVWGEKIAPRTCYAPPQNAVMSLSTGTPAGTYNTQVQVFSGVVTWTEVEPYTFEVKGLLIGPGGQTANIDQYVTYGYNRGCTQAFGGGTVTFD